MMRNATSSHLVSGLASHGVSRCLRVHACVFMCTHFAVRVIFDCVCLRWGRCSFSCSFHDHYITCGIFAATGVYFHPCESWSKLLFKHRLETEIFSDAQTASPIKMIELSLINNSYWKHGYNVTALSFYQEKNEYRWEDNRTVAKDPKHHFLFGLFFTALSCFVHSLCRDTTEEEASYVRFHKDNV